MIRALSIATLVVATIGRAAADPGSAPCALWLKERTTTGAPDLRTWALGRLEEYASHLPDPTSASFAETENVLAHIDIYCEAHPSDHFDHAVQSVLGDFEELRERLEDLRRGG